MFLGGNGFKVRVKVDAGDGISKDFDVDHVDTRRGRTDAIAGAALAQLVANILNDAAIRKYICEGPPVAPGMLIRADFTVPPFAALWIRRGQP